MGKLTFKGDKPKKRKQKACENQVENDKRVKISEEKIDLGKFNLEGWCSATEIADLKGPFIILAKIDKEIKIIEIEDGEVKLGSKVVIEEKENNLLGHLYREDIHKAEPTTVRQVLTFVPIQDKEKSVLDTKGTEKFAFRTYRRTYFSSSFSEEHAIGNNEVFSLKLTPLHVQEYNYELPRWKIFNGGNKLVLRVNENSIVEPVMVHEDSIDSNLTYVSDFVIRVHASNTVKGARLALKMSLKDKLTEDPDEQIRNLLHELDKESRGKIEIDTALVTRLRSALSNGNINEQMIEERSRVISKG